MKSAVLSLDGKKSGEIALPKQFGEDFRPDVINRAFLAYQSKNRQAYGLDPEAGLRSSAKHIARRSIYGSWMNRGMARVARIRVGSGHMTGTVRVIPQARGGRRAHGPNPEKKWSLKINDIERKLAIRSAISATADKSIVSKRGKVAGEHLPIVVEDGFAGLKKAKDVFAAFEKIGLKNELERASKAKVRAGVGKTRGRKYRKRKGPLVVVAEKSKILHSAANIPGIDIVLVEKLNINLLAPGGQPGRVTVWTEGAIKKLEKENLFI